jgi:hypothetical protein
LQFSLTVRLYAGLKLLVMDWGFYQRIKQSPKKRGDLSMGVSGAIHFIDMGEPTGSPASARLSGLLSEDHYPGV